MLNFLNFFEQMASGGSSRGDSRVRRQRVVHDSPVSQPALPLPLSSTSPAVGTSTCQSAVGMHLKFNIIV